MSNGTEHILVQDDDGVRTITMNRPEKRNALTAAMYATMAEALTEAEASPDIAVVVLQGSGGFFTAGNDVKDFLVNPPTGPDSSVFRFMRSLIGCGAPVVAAVDGLAVGIGTTLLLHCDLVLLSPEARLSLPFIDLGLVPEFASSLLLPRTAGHARAAEMLMLGRPMEPERAVVAGIANAVVPGDRLAEEARTLARGLAAKPRNALRQTKALMRAGRPEVEAVMQREGAIFTEALRSPEAIAAFQAFLMKSAAKG